MGFVFDLGAIIWFIWVGISMLRSKTDTGKERADKLSPSPNAAA